jgi:hypothetical protein
MLQVSRRIVAIALLALLGAVVVEASVRYDVQVTGYLNAECSGSGLGTITYENGTRCQDIYQNSYFADFVCSETGSPSGSVCVENACGSCPKSVAENSLEFGQSYCFSGETPNFSVTCLEVSVPEAAPVEVVPGEESPQAVTVPNGEGEVPEESHTPSVLIGSGEVSVEAFFALDCEGPSQTLPFTANIELCQSYGSGASTVYFKFDCFANQTTLAYACADQNCASCTLIPPTRSGDCLNAEISIVKSILITCPASPSAPSAPSGAPTPSGDASSLQVVYASISIIAAVGLLML